VSYNGRSSTSRYTSQRLNCYIVVFTLDVRTLTLGTVQQLMSATKLYMYTPCNLDSCMNVTIKCTYAFTYMSCTICDFNMLACYDSKIWEAMSHADKEFRFKWDNLLTTGHLEERGDGRILLKWNLWKSFVSMRGGFELARDRIQ
jgi:hypothetical protein